MSQDLRQHYSGNGVMPWNPWTSQAFTSLDPFGIVSSYLYGEDPPPFDVLYWNTDSTRLPARMHATYLRECYVKNALIEPDALTLGGRGIDLRRIRQPLYMVGTEQDHIAPWKETFKLCGVVQGPIRYLLATSGHIMGIISPPVDPPKRRYWVGDAEGHGDPETWRAGIPKVLGSSGGRTGRRGWRSAADP